MLMTTSFDNMYLHDLLRQLQTFTETTDIIPNC